MTFSVASRGGDRLEENVTDQRERRSVEERREQLIDAAIAVLTEDGLANATTRRITDRAELALGAFHYAFESKQELLRAVIDRLSEGIEEALVASVTGPVRDLGHFAEQIVSGYWEFVETNPTLQLAQYELTVHALRNPDLRELAEVQYTRMSLAVERALERVPDTPQGRDRTDLARYLAATMAGLVLQYVVERDPDAARRRIELYLATMPALTAAARS